MSVKDMETIIKQGIETNFDPNYFQNWNILVIYKSYHFNDNITHPRFLDVDYMLEIEVIGIIKSNFDVLNEEFKINNRVDDNGITYFTIADSNKYMTYCKWDKVLRFPLKWIKVNEEIVFDKNRKLPCMLQEQLALKKINTKNPNLIFK